MTLGIQTQLPSLHHHHHHHHHQPQLEHQQQPQLLHRLPSTCDRHPEELVTGFCASCLRERLSGLESQSSVGPRTSTSSSSAAAAALKSIFLKGSSSSTGAAVAVPELRRCKSFSCGRGDGFPGPRPAAAFEPQRRSCDVRGRSTLWSLFHQDDVDRFRNLVPNPFLPSSSSNVAAHLVPGEIEIEVEPLNLRFPPACVADSVLEEAHEEDELDDADEIITMDPVLVVGTTGEIDGGVEEVEVKPMKDHIDLESQTKKLPPRDLKEIAGSFWLAASVFSKKLQKWRRKQKLKKQCGNGSSSKAASTMRGDKPLNARRGFRDTQSEIAVDAFGRRSCDTDPRFSLDAGRVSFDDARYSWDEPRASWDGPLNGGRTAFPRLPPMLSVLEDPPGPVIPRSDGQIPVEEDSLIPGGTTQTRDYYLDSSSQRRRRSLDRSNSVRRLSVDMNEQKPVSNAKVSPAGSTEFFHGFHGSKLDRDSRELSSNSLRDDCSESFESAYRDPRSGAPPKKPKRWSKGWNFLGFIHWRSGSRGGGGNGNVVGRSLSESWPELRRQGSNGRILRSNSNVSSRHSFSSSGGLGSMRRSNLEINGNGKKKRDEFMLERNRSARYSPTPAHMDTGLLRFYLTPLRGSRRNGGSLKNRGQSSTHFFTRSVLQMY